MSLRYELIIITKYNEIWLNKDNLQIDFNSLQKYLTWFYCNKFVIIQEWRDSKPVGTKFVDSSTKSHSRWYNDSVDMNEQKFPIYDCSSYLIFVKYIKE
jgi:hypothetical protein